MTAQRLQFLVGEGTVGYIELNLILQRDVLLTVLTSPEAVVVLPVQFHVELGGELSCGIPFGARCPFRFQQVHFEEQRSVVVGQAFVLASAEAVRAGIRCPRARFGVHPKACVALPVEGAHVPLGGPRLPYGQVSVVRHHLVQREGVESMFV